MLPTTFPVRVADIGHQGQRLMAAAAQLGDRRLEAGGVAVEHGEGGTASGGEEDDLGRGLGSGAVQDPDREGGRTGDDAVGCTVAPPRSLPQPHGPAVMARTANTQNPFRSACMGDPPRDEAPGPIDPTTLDRTLPF